MPLGQLVNLHRCSTSRYALKELSSLLASISDVSTFTTCACRGPESMSFRNFCSASSEPWASPMTCLHVRLGLFFFVSVIACKTHFIVVSVLYPTSDAIASGSILCEVSVVAMCQLGQISSPKPATRSYLKLTPCTVPCTLKEIRFCAIAGIGDGVRNLWASVYDLNN